MELKEVFKSTVIVGVVIVVAFYFIAKPKK